MDVGCGVRTKNGQTCTGQVAHRENQGCKILSDSVERKCSCTFFFFVTSHSERIQHERVKVGVKWVRHRLSDMRNLDGV